MKTYLNKIMEVIVYFFTPEDSATPIHRSIISFNIERDAIGIGSVKALFWVMNAMIFISLISM
ncbi:MAG: hypothetical protein L3J69_01955 [Desulfobacula sp.]|nr:hypothetical protein [Desulfobacula sp.]